MKLCQSSSISGPSLTLYPILEKISIILFFTIVIGCLEPISIEFPGLVRSFSEFELAELLDSKELKSLNLF